MNTLIGDNLKIMDHFDKTKLLFETTDKYILNMFTPILKNIESILNN